MDNQENNRWTWDVSGFQPDDSSATTTHPFRRRYSISATRPSSSDIHKHSIASKFQSLADQFKHAREDYLELRQEASDLREYSNAKLDRITRYLGYVADKAHKLDQTVLESEARISPLINEKKRLFNELLTTKGNVKVFCRTRPLFEDEGQSIAEYPDDFTIRLNLGDDSAKKDFEFDHVYGPHIGQGDFFHDVRPFVQSSFDGFNVSIFAYGQTSSGKTHTMEGSNHDRGLYVRCFEELFDLSNADATSISQYDFYLTVFELYNDQVKDLLLECNIRPSKIFMGPLGSAIELVQEKVVNPLDFIQVLKSGLERRGEDVSRNNMSHLVVTIHIRYSNCITSEKLYSKLSLVDLAGSESLLAKDISGEIVKDFLHVSKSLSALGDVLSSLTSKKEFVPYENSKITKLLSDVLGGNAKTLVIVNVCPTISFLSNTQSCLNFSARARNAELSLGNRDTMKKWKDVANDSRKELCEKEKEVNDLRQEMLELKIALQDANNHCSLLLNEVDKAWKVSSTLQSDLKSENSILADGQRKENEQNLQLRNQVAHLVHLEQDYKVQIQDRDLLIQNLQDENKKFEEKSIKSRHLVDASLTVGSDSKYSRSNSTSKSADSVVDSSLVIKKLEEELLKRDALIERLHEENEKLFCRLTEKATMGGIAQVSSPNNLLSKNVGSSFQSSGAFTSPSSIDKTETTGALVKSGSEKKTTPAGEYLTAALMDFDPAQYESFATIADGANKLLMLVLAAVIKAGAAREHEILSEIRDAVFSFIRKMESRKVMDTMLVSRVRILYIRSLIARSPELQSIKVSPVDRFLEKTNSVQSRSTSRSNSPGRSESYSDFRVRTVHADDYVHGFKVNIRPEKKSKLSSIVLKLRGIDEEIWRQQVTGGRLREITEDAKCFSVGNKALAALFVHTPAGELQRQIRCWLSENYDFLSVTGSDIGGVSGQLEILSTAIMDGWMAGLGDAKFPSTDALGQLLSDYAKLVYTSQLQHLKDIAGTLATENADDSTHVNKLRSALESVDHKRRKILQQMRNDIALLSREEGGSPVQNTSTAAEDARLASLISLEGILKQVKDVLSQTSVNSITKSKKRSLLTSLIELSERMPSLLDIDHPCAQRQIIDARRIVESIPEDESQEDNQSSQETSGLTIASDASEITQWNVLQFNTGSTVPFIIKCGANSNSDLVVKADARVHEPKGGEIIRIAPKPLALSNMSLGDLKNMFSQLPEALSSLALARTADGTRARYSRLYRTLAMKVPALRDLVGELEKGVLKDSRS